MIQQGASREHPIESSIDDFLIQLIICLIKSARPVAPVVMVMHMSCNGDCVLTSGHHQLVDESHCDWYATDDMS